MKNTLMILAVSAIFGAMLVGCSPAAEGNNTESTAPVTRTGADAKKPADTNAPATNAPAANAPAADAMPADANAPAKK